MAGCGEYQKQVAALMAAAKAENLKLENVLPKEVLKHFQDMTELKAARDLIKDYEIREKELQTANETLTKNLHKKEEIINDLPGEFKSMKVDLQQAQHQIKLHKEVADDALDRANRYYRQLQQIAYQQQVDSSNAEKIEYLQNEVDEQHSLIAKLVEENRATESLSTQRYEADREVLAKKDKQLSKKDRQLAEKNDLLAQLSLEIEQFGGNDDACSRMSSDTEATLLGDSDDVLAIQQENINLQEQNIELETRVLDLQEQIAITKLQLDQVCSSPALAQANALKDRNSQLLAASVSELKPLNRVYKSVALITQVYADFLQATSPTNTPSVDYIQMLLNDAQVEIDDYVELSKLMRAHFTEMGVDGTQAALHQELDALAKSAVGTQSSLKIIHQGFWGFLHQLSDDPKMLSGLNGVLCAASRVHVTELNSCD